MRILKEMFQNRNVSLKRKLFRAIVAVIIICNANIESVNAQETPEFKKWEKWKSYDVKNSNEKEFNLITKGKSNAIIVIDNKKRGTITNIAATKFQEYIMKMTGCKLPIVMIGNKLPKTYKKNKLVLIGESAITKQLGISLDEAPSDGYIIKIDSDYLAIVGRDFNGKATERKRFYESGTYYGVSDFLKELGVFNFWPEEDLVNIPQKIDIILGCSEKRNAPYFPQHYVGARGSVAFFTKSGSRINSFRGHTFKHWYDLYQKEHPDWFVKTVDGKLSPHILFTNKEAQNQVIKDAQEYFDSGKDYFLLIQNDGYVNVCQREETQKLLDRSKGYWGLHTETIMRPFFTITEELKKTHPHKKVVICAYAQYMYPPEGIESFPENAVLHIALRRRSNVIPEWKKMHQEVILEWLKLNPREIYWWEYFTWKQMHWLPENFEMFPRFTPSLIDEDIKRLAVLRKSNSTLKGEWTFQNHRIGDFNSWWNQLNVYIISQLLWDPFQDLDSLLDDIYTKAFETAAPEMNEFYSLCEKTWVKGAPISYELNPMVPIPDTQNITINTDLGHHFFDFCYETKDFLPAWPEKNIEELKTLIEAATVKAKGTDAEVRVEFVKRGFDAFVKVYNGLTE